MASSKPFIRHDVVLLPIRKGFVEQIFDGTKNIEYRTYFPRDFRGTVFIYECGPDSRHAVVGFFTSPFVLPFDRNGNLDRSKEQAFRSMPEIYQEQALMADNSSFAIPICNRTQIPTMSLQEFDAFFKVTKPTDFPRGFRYVYVPRPFVNPFFKRKETSNASTATSK